MKVKKIQSLRALHRHKSSHLIGNDKTEESSVKMSANNDPEGEKDKQFVNMFRSGSKQCHCFRYLDMKMLTSIVSIKNAEYLLKSQVLGIIRVTISA